MVDGWLSVDEEMVQGENESGEGVGDGIHVWFFLGSGFEVTGGYLWFKKAISIDVEQACQKWNYNVGERLWGGAGRSKK